MLLEVEAGGYPVHRIQLGAGCSHLAPEGFHQILGRGCSCCDSVSVESWFDSLMCLPLSCSFTSRDPIFAHGCLLLFCHYVLVDA
jgi:hypothetical protein